MNFLTGMAVAATAEVARQPDEVSLLPLKISLVASICIAIYGLYASHKKKIVVFANLTDIFATVAIPVIAILAFFLTAFLEMKGVLATFVMTIGVLGMAACVSLATWFYNASIGAGILGFILALFTKLFLLTLYVFLILLIFFNVTNRKGESHTAWKRRIRRENMAYIAGTTTIFSILAWLGLWDRNFVTFHEYIHGLWGVDEPA